MRGYMFIVTEENIHRIGLEEDVSHGLLVKDHYSEVYRAILIADILWKGKCKEAVALYTIEDAEEYDNAPTLDRCLTALEDQLKWIDGEKYVNERETIHGLIADLREGHWYKSSPAFDRPGVPRIETIGERIYTAILDMVWKMDNGEKSNLERISEMQEKTWFPDIKLPEW